MARGPISRLDFLEYENLDGNKGYARIDSIAAIFHDGTGTRIVLREVTAGEHATLTASELPNVLWKRMHGD